MVPSLLFLASVAAAAVPPTIYSDTWAGFAQLQQNGTKPFNFAEATLVMPKLKIPKQPHMRVDEYTAAYWIGIDGTGSNDQGLLAGLWQAGVIMSIFTNGTKQYRPFLEWIPDPPVYFDSFKIGEGDHVHVAVHTNYNGSTASMTLNNLNTTKTVSSTQAAPTKWRGPRWTSAGQSAEWIVETGTYDNYTRHVFPEWGNAPFLDSKACRTDGTCVLPSDQKAIQQFENFQSDTEMLNTKSTTKGGRVDIQYIEKKCHQCKVECLEAVTCFNETSST